MQFAASAEDLEDSWSCKSGKGPGGLVIPETLPVRRAQL